jgi:4-hydroxy-tetrahydrodipicolinate synthase
MWRYTAASGASGPLDLPSSYGRFSAILDGTWISGLVSRIYERILASMSFADLRSRLKNVHAFGVTPFRSDDLARLDLDGLSRNLAFMVENGVRVINVGGGTGEIESLTRDELEALAQTALGVAGDRALILPTLPGNLKMALELAPRYEKMGARVVLGMAPFIRNRVPDDLDGVFNYYDVLADASGLPMLVYNTQGWPAEFFVRLAEIDRIVGIKDPCQVPHNLFRAIKLLGDRFVWIGNKRHDPGVLQFRYQAGIEGFTTGFTNFAPEYELELHRAALEEDWPRMVKIQGRLASLEGLRAVHDDAAMLKTSLDLVGLAGGRVRPPRLDVSREGRASIVEALEELGVELKGG